MTKRTYVTKSGDTYEWEETQEVLEALKELHNHNETQNDSKTTSVG